MTPQKSTINALDKPVTVEALPGIPTERMDPDGLDELAQVISAYNQAAENLQNSHESLHDQVQRLQRELVSTNAQLQRSKRLTALGEMAAGIAHEVRNPLAAIQLYAGLLADDLASQRLGDPDALAQLARNIVGAVRGLNAVVNDVLSFAREITPNKKLVAADQLYHDAIEACHPEIDAAGIEVCLDGTAATEDTEPLLVSADPDLIRQALINLIRNAVAAMSDPHVSGTTQAAERSLKLEARREDEQVVLTVRDTGHGIADADIDRIFNPFFTTRNTGTGLGLAIVHRVIDAHGGAINVYNDGGAVFELSIPGVAGDNPQMAPNNTEARPERPILARSAG